MADRTYLQLVVYHCPEHQRPALLEAINEILLEPEYSDIDDTTLQLNNAYIDDGVPVGTIHELAQQVVDAAPDAVWKMWEDPAYEWLGTLYLYTPELGLFNSMCDAEGTAVFDAQQITSTLQQFSYDSKQCAQAFGMAHNNAIVEYRDRIRAKSPTC